MRGRKQEKKKEKGSCGVVRGRGKRQRLDDWFRSTRSLFLPRHLDAPTFALRPLRLKGCAISIDDPDRFTPWNETTEGNRRDSVRLSRRTIKRKRRGFSAINPDHVPFNLPAAKIAGVILHIIPQRGRLVSRATKFLSLSLVLSFPNESTRGYRPWTDGPSEGVDNVR